MKSFVFFYCITLLLTSGCNIYSSVGRKEFESRSEGRVRTDNLDSKLTEDGAFEGTCWLQPSSESIWFIEEGEKFSVSKIDEHQIQVCIQP